MTNCKGTVKENVVVLEPGAIMPNGAQVEVRLIPAQPRSHTGRYVIDLIDDLPGKRLFKTSSEADEYLRNERESWDR